MISLHLPRRRPRLTFCLLCGEKVTAIRALTGLYDTRTGMAAWHTVERCPNGHVDPFKSGW